MVLTFYLTGGSISYGLGRIWFLGLGYLYKGLVLFDLSLITTRTNYVKTEKFRDLIL